MPARRIPAVLVWLVPAAAAVLLYGRCVQFWWAGDELLYLRSVVLHTPAQYLFVPPVYRELSPRFFFPAVLLSFDLDHRLFGLSTGLFFAHQLLSLAAAAGLLALVARRFLPPLVAMTTGLLFLLGPPVPGVVAELMSRHYLDGLAAALGATLLFVRFLEDRRRGWLAGAVGLWFLAALCKEIFVPLPLVLVALPVATWRDRIRAAWPFAAGVGVYAIWRQVMLAGALGGYEESSERISGVPERMSLLGKQFVAVALGSQGTTGLVLAAAALAACILTVVRRRKLYLAAALLVAVAGPLLPVAERLEPRFGLLPWLLVSLLAGAALARGLAAAPAWRAAASVSFLVLLLLAASTSRHGWAGIVAQAARNRAEGEFFLRDSAAGDVLRRPLADATFYSNLRWLRQEVLKGSGAGRVVYDDSFFCEGPPPDVRTHTFLGADGGVRFVPSLEETICTGWRARLRQAPLEVRITYDDPYLSWQMGPHATGTYWILYGDALVPYPAGRSGNLRYPLDELSLRVKYEAPDGGLVYSAPLRLLPKSGHAAVTWKAGGSSGGGT